MPWQVRPLLLLSRWWWRRRHRCLEGVNRKERARGLGYYRDLGLSDRTCHHGISGNGYAHSTSTSLSPTAELNDEVAESPLANACSHDSCHRKFFFPQDFTFIFTCIYARGLYRFAVYYFIRAYCGSRKKFDVLFVSLFFNCKVQLFDAIRNPACYSLLNFLQGK
jgi:hypothetical protein